MVSWQTGMTLRQLEVAVIEKALMINGGNREVTARSLGICRRTLDQRIKDYSINVYRENNGIQSLVCRGEDYEPLPIQEKIDESKSKASRADKHRKG